VHGKASISVLSPPLIQFCICTYVFTAAFCLQFIKEYDDDDDDANAMLIADAL